MNPKESELDELLAKIELATKEVTEKALTVISKFKAGQDALKVAQDTISVLNTKILELENKPEIDLTDEIEKVSEVINTLNTLNEEISKAIE